MKLNALNYNNNVQMPVQTATKPNLTTTAPSQTPNPDAGNGISSAASITASQAIVASVTAQAPVPYAYVGEIKLPYGENAKLFKLATGQKVAILHKKGPTVVKSYFNVGSMNEPDHLRGVSHFDEHMAFNGSKGSDGEDLDAGDFFKITSKMGAMTNASTGFSQTDYYISSQLLGKNDFEKSVSIHSKMLQSPKYDPAMVEKEKGPVTSEISMVSDMPENTAMNNCIKNLFQIQTTSPDLVAGTIKNINGLTRDDAFNYYNLWYTPDNCTTVITGEVDAQTAIDTVARNFNKYKNPPIQNRKYEEFKPIENSLRTDVKVPKAQSSIVVMGFKGPQNSDTKENIKLELLMTSLLSNKNSRISKALDKIQTGASMNIERVGNRPTDPKAILIASQCSSDKSEQVIKTIYDGINSLSIRPLSREELENSKKILKMTFSKVTEDSQLINSLIGSTLADNDINYAQNYLTILDSITPEEIANFAKKHLDLNKVSLSVVHPESTENSALMANYQKANKKFDPTLTKASLPEGAKPVSFKGAVEEKAFDISKIKQYKLPNNMEVVLNPNKSDITSMKIDLDTITPINAKPSVPALLAVILNEGTKNKNYEQFYSEIHKSGVNVKFDADFSGITINIDSLKGDTGFALDKIKEVLANPRLSDASLNYAKSLVKEAVSNMDNSASEKAFKAMFPHLNSFATREEILQTLDSVTLPEIQGMYDYIRNNAQAKVVVTAPFEKDSSIESTVIKKLSTDLGNFKPYKVDHFKSFIPQTENTLLTTAETRNQAEIEQSFKFQTNYNPKDHAAFYLLNTILGDGPYSRLFNDLREQQKLAYRVESRLNFVGNTGVMSLGIKTTTDNPAEGIVAYDNAEKSLAGFNNHIGKIKNELVTPEELESAKLRMKTKILNSIETSDDQTEVLSGSKDTVYGIATTNESLKLIDSITAQDVQNAAEYIFGGKSVTSVLASQNTLDNMKIKPAV